MPDTTIKIDSAVRDRLAVLATQHGCTIRDLVAELAGTTPTGEEPHVRHAAAIAHIREHLCPRLSEEDLAAGERFWRELAAGRVPVSLNLPTDHGRLAG